MNKNPATVEYQIEQRIEQMLLAGRADCGSIWGECNAYELQLITLMEVRWWFNLAVQKRTLDLDESFLSRYVRFVNKFLKVRSCVALSSVYKDSHADVAAAIQILIDNGITRVED